MARSWEDKYRGGFRENRRRAGTTCYARSPLCIIRSMSDANATHILKMFTLCASLASFSIQSLAIGVGGGDICEGAGSSRQAAARAGAPCHSVHTAGHHQIETSKGAHRCARCAVCVNASPSAIAHELGVTRIREPIAVSWTGADFSTIYPEPLQRPPLLLL